MTHFKIGQQAVIKDNSLLPNVSQVSYYKTGATVTIVDVFYGIVEIKLNEQPRCTKVASIGLWKAEHEAIEVIDSETV